MSIQPAMPLLHCVKIFACCGKTEAQSSCDGVVQSRSSTNIDVPAGLHMSQSTQIVVLEPYNIYYMGFFGGIYGKLVAKTPISIALDYDRDCPNRY